MAALPNTKDLELPYGGTLSETNSLLLDYNGHMGSYRSIEDYYEDCLGSNDDWISEEERKLALEHNSVWSIYWYPTTPIGSYRILCYSLEKGLKALKEIDARLLALGKLNKENA